ncbi:MAG TPA: YicC/YloC family endoribonuclease [Stellaceae bacterium]|nr:YicC/YloC family endoribonuclease [Stellaceae bacterium]
MAVSSMTGFARVEGQIDEFRWAWELRSVNGKSLDIRFRLPGGFEVLEVQAKPILSTAIKRGSLTANLTISERERASTLRINDSVLNQLIELIGSLEGRVDAAPPRLDTLLAFRGVIETGDDAPSDAVREARLAALLDGFVQAVAALVQARDSEGARLHQVLSQRLDEIGGLIGEAEASAAAQPAAIRERFRIQIAALFENVPPLPEERLAQEIALLIARADVREELDRLQAHMNAARDLMAEGTAVGRRFDFLCQEFNREVNTLCSKSADIGLTRIGLALKAAVEQLREQVQNIE